MRMNLPVTQHELTLAKGATLLSLTDPNSHILYANGAFVDASGFDLDELVGQPHNLVRHPDMPPAAFADMWATLKSGQSWTGLVKNRRKNGDHYWVRANATPMVRQGRVVGFLSVRTTPDLEEVRFAEEAYRAMREGRKQRRQLHRGLLVRTGLSAWRSMPQLLSLRHRLSIACLLGFAPAGIAAGAGLGVAGVLSAALAGAAAAWLWLEMQIAQPMDLVLQSAVAVAAGQAEGLPSLNRVDAIGMTQRAVNQAGLNLRSLLDDVSRQVSGVRSASAEIAVGNADLMDRCTTAASSLQEVAASVREVSQSVAGTAQAARKAAELADGARSGAERGGRVMDEVTRTMQAITESSHRIGDIIGVIDGIAFQTNILALNAAVEAARAGEQGKGFAVVAGEVRSLAQRCASAAQEIKALIGASTQRVESGAKLTEAAGQAMSDIVQQVQCVSELIGELGAAASEQASGVAQIDAAMTTLDQLTQHNAALVEQSGSTSQALNERAERLVQAIDVFDSRNDRRALSV